MILDSALLKLEAVLSSAVSANQPDVHVEFLIWNQYVKTAKPAVVRNALNGTTDVTILAPPNEGEVREPTSISIYNKDTASVTVTVKTDDGTTERIVIKAVLLTLESLHWERGQGWYALDANGNRKEVTASIFSSLTVTGNATLGDALTDAHTVNGTLSVTGLATLALLTKSISYTAGDTTPSVLNASFMDIANSGAVTISNFDDGVNGQVIVLHFQDANTTINRANAYLSGGVNFVSSANDTLTLIRVANVWTEVARGVNS